MGETVENITVVMPYPRDENGNIPSPASELWQGWRGSVQLTGTAAEVYRQDPEAWRRTHQVATGPSIGAVAAGEAATG